MLYLMHTQRPLQFFFRPPLWGVFLVCTYLSLDEHVQRKIQCFHRLCDPVLQLCHHAAIGDRFLGGRPEYLTP